MPSASSTAQDARTFFSKLRKMTFGPGKPDADENLIDILELVAVYLGIKPAHLQGQGQWDAGSLDRIADLAADAGLKIRRTGPFREWLPRPYDGDTRFYEWQHMHAHQNGPHDRLWVFRGEAVAAQIDAALAGAVGVGRVLGYPLCCETAYAEESLQVHESLERGYRREHGATELADLVRLASEDRPVHLDIDWDPGKSLNRTMEKFPFLSFAACDDCLHDAGSPAAKLNNSLRILARDLEAKFARDIKQKITWRTGRLS